MLTYINIYCIVLPKSLICPEDNVPQCVDCGKHAEVQEIFQHSIHDQTDHKLRHCLQPSLPLLLGSHLHHDSPGLPCGKKVFIVYTENKPQKESLALLVGSEWASQVTLCIRTE